MAVQRLELGDRRRSVRNWAGLVCCHGDFIMESDPIQLASLTGIVIIKTCVALGFAWRPVTFRIEHSRLDSRRRWSARKFFTGFARAPPEGVKSRAIQPQHGSTTSSRIVRSLA